MLEEDQLIKLLGSPGKPISYEGRSLVMEPEWPGPWTYFLDHPYYLLRKQIAITALGCNKLKISHRLQKQRIKELSDSRDDALARIEYRIDNRIIPYLQGNDMAAQSPLVEAEMEGAVSDAKIVERTLRFIKTSEDHFARLEHQIDQHEEYIWRLENALDKHQINKALVDMEQGVPTSTIVSNVLAQAVRFNANTDVDSKIADANAQMKDAAEDGNEMPQKRHATQLIADMINAKLKANSIDAIPTPPAASKNLVVDALVKRM